jgi:hypothetical protein
MKMISRRTHGYLDYVVAIIMIACPWILGFNHDGPDTWILVILGIITILYSLMTNYELGMLRVIPMKAHLVMDAIAAILLIASPWLFGFSDYVFMPHVILGAFELLAVLMTRTTYETMTSGNTTQMAH